MSPEIAMNYIANLLTNAESLISEAERLAVNSGLIDLCFPFTGGTYGMGGWLTENGWKASSESC